MARKNLLTGLIDAKLPAGNSGGDDKSQGSSESAAAIVRQGAIGAISRSIAELKQQVIHAEGLKQKLADGQAIVELDPDALHPAFLNDRLGVADGDEASLLESIKANGQQVPILVRPHPDRPDEYQIAYGHRRVRGARALGIKVRAVVKPLSDAELIVAQGTENSARADLSFIERALFAYRLEEKGFSRDVIMAALSVDKTVLSKLISVPSRLPARLIEAIGRAPAVGRDRWLELVALLTDAAHSIDLEELTQSARFAGSDTDQRFELVMSELTAVRRSKTTRSQIKRVLDDRGQVIAKLDEKPKALVITVSGKPAPGLSEFIANRLPSLLKEFGRSGSAEL
jgi:ParB family transcriptional regulator, chromosome partitioning protein